MDVKRVTSALGAMSKNSSPKRTIDLKLVDFIMLRNRWIFSILGNVPNSVVLVGG